MSNKVMIQNTIRISLQCSNLFLLFLFFRMLLGFISTFPVYSAIKSGDPLSIGRNAPIIFLISIISIFVIAFFDAGFYGLVFLKINSKEIYLNRFTNLAKKNFWGFFRISIIIGLIQGLYWILVPPILKVIFADGINHASVNSSSVMVLSLLTTIFFVFSFPLVTIGFFSNDNLKPIRSSFSIVIKNIKAIMFIIILLFLKFILIRILVSFIPGGYILYQNTLLPLITSPLSFLILVYSFLFLTKDLYKDLKFDFENITSQST